MENEDKLPFVKLLTAVCALHERSLHEYVIEIYWQALVGFEFRAVKQAFEAHIKHPHTGQFMPKPADILRYLQGDHEVQALQAWSRLQQALREIGGNQTVVFDDPLLHQVVEEMGGWISFAERTQQSMDFLVHEFKKRYAAYVFHPPTTYPRQLTGRLNAHNQRHQTAWLPILIGNPQKAERVYRQGRAPGLSHSITPLRLSEDPESSPQPLPPAQKNNPEPTEGGL